MSLPLIRPLVAFGLTAGLAITHAWAQAPAAPAKDAPALTVNGEAQPAQHLDWLLQEQLARGAADTPALRARVRETVINQTLMAQAALKAKLERQPEVRAQLALARQNALAQAWQRQALSGVQITEADVAAEYQRQVQAMGTQEVRLRHVLVASEEPARQVLARLAGGEAFEALAGELSRDNTTKARGGLSDWVPVGSLAPRIAEAVKGLQPGALVPQPVETPSGWQVLMLEAQRPLVAPALATVQGQLRRTLAQRVLQVRLQALRDAARVE